LKIAAISVQKCQREFHFVSRAVCANEPSNRLSWSAAARGRLASTERWSCSDRMPLVQSTLATRVRRPTLGRTLWNLP